MKSKKQKLGRPTRFNPKSKIIKLVNGNPRRKGTKAHNNFKLMRAGSTVQRYRNAGGCLRDLRYSVDNGWITIQDKA